MKAIELVKKSILKSDIEIFKKDLKEYDINEVDDFGNNILHYYIKEFKNLKFDYKEVIDFFIKKGLNINTKQSKGFKRSPLHLAVFMKLMKITDYLIDLGAEINSTDSSGNSILMTSVTWYREKDDSFIKKMIENNADIYQENNYGRSSILNVYENDGNEELYKYFPCNSKALLKQVAPYKGNATK